MEKKQNTYIALENIQFDTYVMVGSNRVLIQFRGGTLEPRRNGTFTTNDPKLIEAMDKDSGINKTFKLFHSDVVLTEEVPAPGSQEDRKDWLKVEGTTTVQKAKDWLINASKNKEHGVKDGLLSSQIANKSTVLALAEEFHIEFVDLPK
jgi:hypothetical protein